MITDFSHGADLIKFSSIARIDSFQELIDGGTIDAHSVGRVEAGGNAVACVNTTATGETVGSAQMEVAPSGTGLGLTATDFLLA